MSLAQDTSRKIIHAGAILALLTNRSRPVAKYFLLQEIAAGGRVKNSL
jgi:hypothetical protein